MELLGQTAAFSTAILVMLIGLVGIILPVLPGLILIWLAALGFAIVEHFARIDPWTFGVLTLLAIVGVSADVWMSQLGARLGGATTKSQLVGLLGGVIGALLFLVFGGISAGLGAFIGSIAGVLLAEYLRLKEWQPALRAGGGWLLGWLASTIFQLTMGGLMILLFVWQAFSG